jgi:hypothetical protein
MTDTELRIKVAELCGWKDIRLLTQGDLDWNDELHGWVGSLGGVPFWYKGKSPESNMEPLPHYESDLNYIHDAVETLRDLDGPQWYDFQHYLLEECGSGMNCIQATARQRALAFIETLEHRETNCNDNL